MSEKDFFFTKCRRTQKKYLCQTYKLKNLNVVFEENLQIINFLNKKFKYHLLHCTHFWICKYIFFVIYAIVGGWDSSCKHYTLVRFEVLTLVTMDSSIFWDIMPNSQWKFTDVSEEHSAFIFTVKG
jgi:hypothetical protein